MPDSAEHIARLPEHINAEAGTTPQQKARIDALLEQARRDFEPVHAQMKEDHELAIALLTEDRVDRAELETLRQNHLRMADQASMRATRLVADIADVLTPAQRKALAAKSATAPCRPRGMHHMGTHHGGWPSQPDARVPAWLNACCWWKARRWRPRAWWTMSPC